MASIFSHPAIALGLKPFFGSVLQSKTILFAGIILTIFPDVDIIGLRLGIPYEHMFGHRGISHSLPFAFIISGITSWLITRSEKNNIKYTW